MPSTLWLMRLRGSWWDGGQPVLPTLSGKAGTQVPTNETREWLATITAVLVLLLWAVSMLCDAFMVTYEQSVGVTPIALIAAGFLFGHEFMTRAKNGKVVE